MFEMEFLQQCLLVAAIALLAASIVRPYLGLLGYLITFYARFGELFPVLGEIRFELIIGLYLGILVVLTGGLDRLRPTFNPVNKAMLAFICVVLLSVPLAFNPETAWRWAVDFVKIYALFLMTTALVRTEPELKAFVWVVMVLTLWVALEPGLKYLNGDVYIAQGVKRVSGSTGYFQNPNALANTILQTLPMMVYLAIASRSALNRALLIGMGVFCTLTIIFTGSRGAFAGFVIGGLVFVLQNRARKGIVILAVCGLASVLLSLGDAYLSRHLSTLEFGKSDVSASSRIDGLKHGLGMMMNRPVLGVGIGNYPEARRAWFGWSLWAHNHYGQLAGELGLVGIAVWFWLLWRIVLNLRETKQVLVRAGRAHEWIYHLALAVEASLAIRLVIGMSNHSLYSYYWYLMAALSVATLGVARGLSERASGTAVPQHEEGRADVGLTATA